MKLFFKLSNIMIDQNIILLILILISVLVAFYALYIGLSNGRKIRKQQQELINIINLNKDNLMNHPVAENQHREEESNDFPTLDEINASVENQQNNVVNHNDNEQQNNDEIPIQMTPLDEDIKRQIDHLSGGDAEGNDADSEELEENLTGEEHMENVSEAGEVEEQANLEEGHVEDGEVEKGNVDEVEEGNVDEVLEGKDEEVEEGKDEEVEEGHVEELDENMENSGTDYLSLEDLTEDYLNTLNCAQLREISRRENLRIRGRKNELIERILKKKLVHNE